MKINFGITEESNSILISSVGEVFEIFYNNSGDVERVEWEGNDITKLVICFDLWEKIGV